MMAVGTTRESLEVTFPPDGQVNEMVDPLFSLVIPAYNPGTDLVRTWDKLLPFLDMQRRRWEVIFVCDGCRDGSDMALLSWKRDCHHNIRVLRSRTNRGKGHAVRRGLLRARGDFRIFTDVDLAYSLEMVHMVANQLTCGDDVVIASRAHPQSQIEYGEGLEEYIQRRRLQSRMFSLATRFLLHLRNKDVQAGLKGFSARAVRMMLPYVKCPGFGFDCEVMVACRYFGIKVREVPVRVVYNNCSSTTRMINMRMMLAELLTIRARWRTITQAGMDRSIFVTAQNLEEARRYRQLREKRIARAMLHSA